MASVAFLPATSVEILFWEGSASSQKTEVGDFVIGPSFGHVALKTEQEYISFWSGRCGQEESSIVKKSQPTFTTMTKTLR